MTHSFPPRLASVLTNGDGEPPGAVEEHPGIAPADRGGHGILNGLGGDAEPRHDVAARPDVEHRQPLGLLHTDVDSALRPAQDRGDLVRSVVHGIEIVRSEEHTSELQSLMRSSYAVFCLKKKKKENTYKII